MKTSPRSPIVTVLLAAMLVGATGCTMAAEPAPAEVATDTRPVTQDQNARVPEGAKWTQHYFPSTDEPSDGSKVELHADVLLPEGLAEGEQVPIILSVGSYFSHSGEMSDEEFEHTGPSDRFNDLAEEGKLFERGYGLVLVDLRGFGGSTGCLDFIGAGEQADVKAAVEWTATQPWSTGAVGMYGKSYDAITGLVGNNLNLDSLKAVVAQEPIWDLYRNIWSGGIPRTNVVGIPAEYDKYANLPALPDDDERYRANAAYDAVDDGICSLSNRLGYQNADPASDYWSIRNLAAGAAGTDTPLFFTQGTLEWNTEPEAIETFLKNHDGPQRGWIGPWDHVRGNDRTEQDRLKMGREGWMDEVMSFYDEHLKGIAPTSDYPEIAVQDNTGTWRHQDTWPIADTAATLSLNGGSYVDDGAETVEAAAPGRSFFNRSAPVAQPTRVVGTPTVSVQAEGMGNVMVKLYDVSPDGKSIMFNEQASLIRPGSTLLELKSTDWTLAEGHSLAVEIGTVQANPQSDWIDSPTRQTITVTAAELTVALDDPLDDKPTDGEPAVWLETYLGLYGTVPVPAGDPSFTLPPLS